MQTLAAFRRHVRRLIRERFGSFDRASKESGLSKGHLSQLVHKPKADKPRRGLQGPTLKTIFELAKGLRIDVRDLFTESEREPLLHDRKGWLQVERGDAGVVRESEGDGRKKTEREATDLDVLIWAARGDSDRQIAERLGVVLDEARQRRRRVLFRLEEERQRWRTRGESKHRT